MNRENKRKLQREWLAKRRREYFANKVCIKCGSTHNMQLDHIDPDQKVSHRIWSWSAERREAELAKCQVLCEEHHKEKTAAQRDAKIVHGTVWMYRKYRCRCDACVRAASEDRERWRRENPGCRQRERDRMLARKTD